MKDNKISFLKKYEEALKEMYVGSVDEIRNVVINKRQENEVYIDFVNMIIVYGKYIYKTVNIRLLLDRNTAEIYEIDGKITMYMLDEFKKLLREMWDKEND